MRAKWGMTKQEREGQTETATGGAAESLGYRPRGRARTWAPGPRMGAHTHTHLCRSRKSQNDTLGHVSSPLDTENGMWLEGDTGSPAGVKEMLCVLIQTRGHSG